MQITRAKGMNLSDVIERFLITFVSSDKEHEMKEKYPDVVLSLLGKGAPIDDNDINGRVAYHEHLINKYK